MNPIDPAALSEAIRVYFKGERDEMVIILAGCAVALALVAWLYFAQRDAFAQSFGLITLFGVVLLASVAIGILVRDPPHAAKLLATLNEVEPQRSRALEAESQRMQTVIAKYPSYRYIMISLALAGLIGAVIFRSGLANGIAAGLCVLFVAQAIVDHYSEARARSYFERLQPRVMNA